MPSGRPCVMFGNCQMLEIWDRPPSIQDMKDFAVEKGWPPESIDGWKLEEWSMRPSTAL